MKQEHFERLKKLGANIAYYRKLRGFTQKELAEKAGLSVSYVAKAEIARCKISLRALGCIANALDAPMSKLFDV